MKCQNCGSELRFGQEQVAFDVNNNPIFHQFSYCDNCKMKLDLTLQQNCYPTTKKESVCGIIGMILSFLSCHWIIAIPAIVLCIIALKNKNKKNTCAIIGLSFGMIMFLLGILAPTYLSYVKKAQEENGITETVIESDIDVDEGTEEILETEPVVEEKEEVVEEENKIEYIQVDSNTLISDLTNNALKAEKTYQKANLEITGKLSVIDSDGNYITLSRTDNEYSFTSIMCYIKNDEQLNTVLEMCIGDTVVVKGQVKQIGEVLGYSVDIHELYIVTE